MSERSELEAAVAAGVIGSEEAFRSLLAAIVEVARSIFGAKASSILLLDEETEELVFEAVVGEGEQELLGMRFPAGKGIAGWVLATRTPLVIEDVREDPRFASDVAEDTGYVPSGLMAAPAPARRAVARRARGARPPGRVALQPAGDGAPGAVRAPGLDRGRPAAEGAEGRAGSWRTDAGELRSSRGSRRRSTSWRTIGARQA